MNSRLSPTPLGIRPGRAIHLIDIENLTLGSSGADPLQTLGLYLHRSRWTPGDLSFVSGPAGMLSALWNTTAGFRPRWLPAVGPDAADLALLKVAPPDWVVDRFDRLVVGSGDHIFAPLLSSVAAGGAESVVVARPGTVSLLSRMAAGRTVDLDPFIPAGRSGTVPHPSGTGITVA